MSRRKRFSADAWHARLVNWIDWSRTDTGKPAGTAKSSRDMATPVEEDAARVDALVTAVRLRSSEAAIAMWALRAYYERELYDAHRPYRALTIVMETKYRRAWTQRQDGLRGEERAERMVARGLRMLSEEEDRTV